MHRGLHSTRGRFLLALAVIGLVLVPAQAFAAITNAGFESGFTDWSVSGIATNSAIGVAPVEGSSIAQLRTAGSGASMGAFGGSNGTLMTRQVELLAGQTVTVKYNFLSSDYIPDFGYGDLLASDGTSYPLFSVDIYTAKANYAGEYPYSTGWLTGSATVPVTGTYTMRFVVSNYGDSILDCALALDDIRLSPVIVSTAADESDGDYSAGDLSLREAIELANVYPDNTVITFDIGSGGPQTIMLDSELPAVTERAEFRGGTQPGSNGSPIVKVSAANLGGFPTGLRLATSNSLVEALGFEDFYRGISVTGDSSVGNLFNALYVYGARTAMAIDLAQDGITANDAGDADAGPNNRQNFPLLGWVSADGRSVSGTLNGAPSRTYLLQFYATDAPGLGWYGLMQHFIGYLEVTIDAEGNAPFTFAPPGPLGGPYVSAFATDRTTNDTSELSPCASVVAAGPDVTVDEGSYSVFDMGDFVDYTSSGPWSLTYSWGDGQSEFDMRSSHGDLNPTPHVYADNGTYIVMVGVSGPTGSGSDTMQVTVENVAPSVELGADRDAFISDPVSFMAEFEDPGYDDTHTYAWDFGDGTTSTEKNPTHTYTMAGNYTITLKVTDDDGGMGSDTMSISVIEPVKAPVYRFYNVKNGTHFYTASASERDHVIATWPGVYQYEGIVYYTCTTRATSPLIRLYNNLNGSHFYTASGDEATRAMMFWPELYTYEGPTYHVRRAPVPGASPVYRFYNKKNGSHFYTASSEEAEAVKAKWSKIYEYEGVSFWVGQ
jgi:PKD repeat protein